MLSIFSAFVYNLNALGSPTISMHPISSQKGLSSLLDCRLYLGGDLVDPVDLLNHLYLGAEKYQTDG